MDCGLFGILSLESMPFEVAQIKANGSILLFLIFMQCLITLQSFASKVVGRQ